MATKHLCDRCNSVVETQEEFTVLQMHRHNANRVARQAEAPSMRMELCSACASDVHKCARTAPKAGNQEVHFNEGGNHAEAKTANSK